jgi:hypothetical protein
MLPSVASKNLSYRATILDKKQLISYNTVILLQEDRVPTIRIDGEVYAWLQLQARPFEDTPNSVLRRVAGLDLPKEERKGIAVKDQSLIRESDHAVGPTALSPRLSGKKLKEKWNIPARQVLYHQDGTFYENLREFPGALCDPNGYVLFSSKDEYNSSSYLHIGLKLNIPEGIFRMPGYRRFR